MLSYLQGELKLNQGDYEGAVKLFKKSIDIKPNFLKSYTSLSLSYLELGKLVKSENILLKAFKLMPNNSSVLIELGIYYYSEGNYPQAIDYFELLAQQTPNNYIAHLNISACHYLNGDIKKSISSAEISVSIKPNAEGYANIGTAHFILNDFNKAVVAFEKVITLNKSNHVNWGNLADAYRYADNDKYQVTFNQAILLAKQAIELNPNNKYAIALLSYYYANLGDIKKTNYYANLITNKDLGENTFFIAAAYARLQMNDIALKYLEFTINNNYSISEISNSPLFDNLRGDHKYRKLISK